MPKKKALPKAIALNPEQQAACNAGRGIWQVRATAGAGKTSVLVERYKRLASEGTSPDQILGLTFTANAAKNMRERAGEVQKMERLCGFVTFHSLCLSICIAEKDNFSFKLADFPLATESQANKLISTAATKYQVDFKRLRGYISRQRRNGVSPKEAVKEAEAAGEYQLYALAYKYYEFSLREAKLLDFDAMLFEVIILLQNSVELRDKYSWEFIMIDEAQDCCAQDYKLIKLISEKHQNLYFVGDSNQSIFGFRGSDSSLFQNIQELFPTVQKLSLRKNHRSTKAIVSYLNTIAPEPDNFYTDNTEGVEPVITKYASSSDEAMSVVTHAKANPKATMAVLARTNFALRSIEDALNMEGIKYKLINNSGFWAQPEVRTVCAYVQSILFPSNYALDQIIRGSFHPTKYLKRKEILFYLKEKTENFNTYWSGLLAYSPSESSQQRAVSNLVNFLLSLQRLKYAAPKEAVQKVLASLNAFESLEEEVIDNSPIENLKELERIAARFSTIQDFVNFTFKASAASKSRSGVVLATCHAAKGLEFPTVFFVAVNEGVIPHAKSTDKREEANTFFVGCSRAENQLFISYTGQPSEFLQIKTEEREVNEIFA
jgi:DNA helicase-2/ATP-dependent DNA helicase PcrA